MITTVWMGRGQGLTLSSEACAGVENMSCLSKPETLSCPVLALLRRTHFVTGMAASSFQVVVQGPCIPCMSSYAQAPGSKLRLGWRLAAWIKG